MGQAKSISNYFIAPREFIEMYATLLSSVEGSGRLTIWYHVSEIRRSEFSHDSYDLSPLVSHIPQVDLIDCQVQNLARWGHPRLFLFLLISYVTQSLVKIFSEKESIEPRIYESWRKLFQEVLHCTGTWSQEPFNWDNPLVESGRKTRVFKDYAAAVLSFVPSPLNQL